jgi:hypothetical protein
MNLDIIFKTYYSRLYKFKWESDPNLDSDHPNLDSDHPNLDFNFVYIGKSNRHFTYGKTYKMFSITSEPYNVRLLDSNQQIISLEGDVFSELFLTKVSWRESQLDNILQ